MKHILVTLLFLPVILSVSTAQNDFPEPYNNFFEWVIEPEYDNVYDIPDVNIVTVKKKGSFGYIDITGKIIVPMEWGYATIADSYGYGIVAKAVDNWKFYINLKKNESTPAFEGKFQHAGPFIQGYAVVGTPGTSKYGIIDTTGTFVIPYTHGLIVSPGNIGDILSGKSNDLIPVKFFKNSGLGMHGLVNRNNEWIVSDKYVFTYPRVDDFYPVEYMWFKKGLLDIEGNLVVDMKYKEIKGLGEAYLQARLDNNWGLIDGTDHQIIPFEYDFICNFDSEGKAYFEKKDEYGYIYAKDARSEVKGKLDRESIKDYAGIAINGTYAPFSFENSDKSSKRKIGIGQFKDDRFDIVIKPKFGEVKVIYINGKVYYRVMIVSGSDNYYGLYDDQMNMVIDAELKEFSFIGLPNSSGYISVCFMKKCGVVKCIR